MSILIKGVEMPIDHPLWIVVHNDGTVEANKVASFNDEKTMRWFIECLDDALKQANVKRFPADKDINVRGKEEGE